MAALLALAAAVSFGTADFFGGAAARRSAALSVIAISAPVGTLFMLVVSVFLPGTPTLAGLAWGAGAGLCGALGVVVFYTALAAGPMSVVAPLSALSSALVPVAAAFLFGERLAPRALIGALLCLVAIALVSAEKKKDGARRSGAARGVLLAVVSGAGFGLFFVLSKHADAATGLWPLVAARLSWVAVAGVAALAGAVRIQRDRVTIWLAVLSGLLDAGGNALYLVSARGGTMTLAVLLTSLYPAITVLLARVTYGELLRGVQKAGLVLAGAGVALLAVAT
ncbi:MAG TPA: EamA family transporter [Streptosporangiaceae bacterium]|jgi:drug/metabolite transporter (DMT)-like permease